MLCYAGGDGIMIWDGYDDSVWMDDLMDGCDL